MATFETISADLLIYPDNAYVYANDDHSVTIAPGVAVSSSTSNGFLSLKTGSELINNGIIHGSSNGVAFSGAGSSITNNAGHTIIGGFAVIYSGNGHVINNHGTLIGFSGPGIGLDTTARNVVVDNDGEIYGHTSGVGNEFALGEVTINNSGRIASDRFGVQVEGPTGTINNAEKGIVRGTVAAVSTSTTGGQVIIDNLGQLDGKIDLNALGAADIVRNAGTITGDIGLGPGNDVFVFVGGHQAAVSGEAGADRFDFSAKLASKKNVATIGDFLSSEDAIGLSRSLFKKIGKEGLLQEKFFALGKKAADKNDHVVYKADTGELRWDKDGEGGSKAKLFAILNGSPDLSADDFLLIA